MRYDKKWALHWLNEFNNQIINHKQLLSDLDQAIGDGDHGINMARGATELKKTFENETPETLKDVFKVAAMTLLSKVGGAAGPLYGSAFLNISKEITSEEFSAKELAKAIESGLEGIETLGHSTAGEKTMIDVWQPVVSALHQEELTDDVIEVALEKTKKMQATKGRASYLGDRSIGHLDPGAYSSAILFHAMLSVSGDTDD
ncbi:dihydroxyacetone kinase subunit DhaL [Listeria sp. PSOL-1]|uniref:dihydroxyacetone kinase subunit DhaL n=1 Tax=Listeria sp. PSOL-1 TaxID=1844999 RepID=UPI0013D24180|nr:dihydroxyacetone kinase subunit DhaL [Listeria sp. PSOL-1]